MFSEVSENVIPYFTDIKTDLKKAGIRESLQEYLSIAILTCLVIFLIELPVFSFIFGFVFQSFLFAFITSITVALFLTVAFFFLFLNYPKTIIREKAKKLDRSLPFALLYLSTVAGSKLPLFKVFEIFARFGGYKEVVREVSLINEDIRVFGLDINTALERAVERVPSEKFQEMLWGILSTIRSGGDLNIYLKAKSKNLMEDYRRKLYEFSRTLAIYIEVYLIAIVLGSVFFTILTGIVSGIMGGIGNILILQFILIFVLIPLVSILFIFLVKISAPVGE
jgi:flagellar protein FlaJ